MKWMKNYNQNWLNLYIILLLLLLLYGYRKFTWSIFGLAKQYILSACHPILAFDGNILFAQVCCSNICWLGQQLCQSSEGWRWHWYEHNHNHYYMVVGE